MTKAAAIINPLFYGWNPTTGDPLAGGKLYAYEPGTSTPKDTYTDETATTKNAHPVVLKASGYAPVYLKGTYKIVLHDASDVEVWSKDPVTGAAQLAEPWVRNTDATFVSTTKFEVTGNQTTTFVAGRRVKLEDDTTLYGSIDSSVYLNPNTEVTVTIDSGTALTASLSSASVSNDTPYSAVQQFDASKSKVDTSTGTDQPLAEALDSRVIYVDTITELLALPTGDLVDGQSADVSGSLFKRSGGQWVLSGEYVTVEAYSDHATATDWAPAFRQAISDGYGKILATQTSYDFETRVDNIASGTVIDLNGAKVVWKGTGLGTLTDAVFMGTGTLTSTQANVVTTTSEYGQEIELDSAPFSVGDYVQVDPATSTSTSVYAQYVFRVDAVSGNFIYSNYPLFLQVFGDGAIVKKIDPIIGASVVNAKMHAEGQTSRSEGIGAIIFSRSVSCSAENITAEKFWFKTCKGSMSLDLYFKDIFTNEPAATGGGEGYGVQFEYCYLSRAINSRTNNARHCVDFTASGICEAEDCFSSNSDSAGFLTHKANEYDITFKRCHSYGDESGFSLGILSSGFADTSSGLKMIDCSCLNFVTSGITYIQKGRGLLVDGFKARPKDPSTFTGHSINVSNADVSIKNIDVEGKVRVNNPTGATSDGHAYIDASRIADLPSNRALSVITDGRVKVQGSRIEGRIEILTSGNAELFGTEHIAESGNPYASDTTGFLAYHGGRFRFGDSATSYSKPSTLILDDVAVERINSGAQINSEGGMAKITGNCGDIRIIATGGDLIINSARITGRITASSLTGRLTIVGSFIQGRVDDLGTGSYHANISSSEFGENLTVGSAGQGHVINNWVTGTVTLPAASGTMIVKDNV